MPARWNEIETRHDRWTNYSMVSEVPAMIAHAASHRPALLGCLDLPVPYQLRKFTVRAECVRMIAEVAYHLNETLLHRRHVQLHVTTAMQQGLIQVVRDFC